MLTGELEEIRTAQTVFTFYDEPQRDRQFAEGLLISFHRHQTRQQIALAIRGAARVELPVQNRSRERADSPICQMAHRLHIVMTIDKVTRPAATFAVDDGIARAHLE